MDLYVANLNTSIEEEGLNKLFEVFGEVTSAILIRDKETRISKGYGFVKMTNAVEAERAIDEMNDREIAGNTIIVKEANPKGTTTVKSKEQDLVRLKFKNDGAEVDANRHEKSNSEQAEDIPVEVIDKMDFSTSTLEDGLVKVKFKN